MNRFQPILALLVVVAACGGPDRVVVAEVGGRPISWDAYSEAYVDYLAASGLPDVPARRMGFLERMISMELVRQDAREHGLAEGPEWEEAEERARRRLLVDAWVAQAAWDTVSVDPSELEALFARVNTEITARHLFAPTAEGAARLSERLAAGERFEDLAREVFADPVLAENGGSLGTFGFDEMDPAFEDAAWSLAPGQVSDPVRTSQGWSIIRVDDRFTKPIVTETEFASRIPMMRAYILERERAAARRRLMDGMLRDSAPEIDATAADYVLTLLGPQPLADETVDADATLFRYRGGEWTVGDFLRAARYTSPEQRSAVRDRPSFEAFATGLLVRDLIMARSLAAGLDRSRRYREAMEGAMDQWLYDRGYERIATSEPIPEDSLRAWFDSFEGPVMVPERVSVREIVTTSRESADSIRSALGRSSFDELARRHSVRSATAASGGELGFLTRTELGPLADRVFNAPLGAVLGPVPVPGFWLLLQVGAREPAHPATFDEARGQVEAIVRREHRDRLVADRAARLRETHEVRYADVDLPALPLEGGPVVSS